MINSDKYKKNKFRRLVPTSTSEADRLQQLTTIDHDKEASRPFLTISQEMKKSTSKIGVEGVSQRYKEKHFAFERRLKTISSMNQREEETIKFCNSSVGQYRIEKERPHENKTKLESLMSIIDQFKANAQRISKAECMEQLDPMESTQDNQEQQKARMEDLTQKTKLASTRLLHRYIQRHINQTKSQILSEIIKSTSKYNQIQHQINEANVVLQINENERKPKNNNCRRNLLNVSKFFKST